MYEQEECDLVQLWRYLELPEEGPRLEILLVQHVAAAGEGLLRQHEGGEVVNQLLVVDEQPAQVVVQL